MGFTIAESEDLFVEVVSKSAPFLLAAKTSLDSGSSSNLNPGPPAAVGLGFVELKPSRRLLFFLFCGVFDPEPEDVLIDSKNASTKFLLVGVEFGAGDSESAGIETESSECLAA